MAAVGMSFGSFEKNSNGQENWQDANAALLELDKGLRSSKVGEQCQAIVRIPNLFEKYPLPILINSAFLKLAEVFRIGSNFLRLCILKVTQRSEKHLDKILNIDEFLRRIYSVIHSNDPIARTITIRVLGSIASIIAERKNAHHSIRTSLDSHDQVELEAAIFATGQFCAQSRSFASGIFNKLAQMIEGLTTPVEMKLKLIPIFRHMHYEVQLATKVHALCLSLLTSHPACKFVIITLHTLSGLAAASVGSIPKQIELLLSYLASDPRKAVKLQVLVDLKILAKSVPHMWKSQHVQSLCDFLLKTSYDSLKLGGISTLVTLSTTLALEQFNQQKVLQVCDQESSSPNMSVAALSSELLVNLATARIHQDEGDVNLCQQAAQAVESTAVVCCVGDYIQPLKICLLSMNRLVDAYPEACVPLVDSLVTLLPSVPESIALEICHALVTMSTQVPTVLVHLRSELVSHFISVAGHEGDDVFGDKESRHNSDDMVVAMATLIFQSHQHLSGEEDVSVLQTRVENIILKDVNQLSAHSKYWIVYRLARQASRQGFHCLAAKMFDSLASKVASEHFYFWLSALKCFCEAESLVAKPCDTQLRLAEQISHACSKYHKGIVALKAAVTPSHQLAFQVTYTRLRADMLQAHSLLLAACACMKSCPPPAIATAVAMATGQDVHSLSHFAAQISDCSRLFRSLGESYSSLYRSSFDADTVSLRHVETLQQSCYLIAHSIDLLTKNTSSSFSGFQSPSHSRGGRSALSDACTQILQTIEDYSVQLEATPVCHVQTECLCKASLTLLQTPLVFPKYFFQSRQHTTIKMALSPSARSHLESVPVVLETQFVLKVEGVIEHGGKPGIYRSVNSVSLHVTWKPEERKHHHHSEIVKIPRDTVTSLEQTVTPHHDYFSAQFLLSFSTAATYQVTVNTSVIDDTGARWDTGPQNTLVVRASETHNRQRATSSRV